jgi:pentose-5-phosphate-3-epimerase
MQSNFYTVKYEQTETSSKMIIIRAYSKEQAEEIVKFDGSITDHEIELSTQADINYYKENGKDPIVIH